MDLNKFSKTIEFEIHGMHELSTETVVKIYELVGSDDDNPSLDESSTLTYKNSKPNLKPFDKVLISTINHSLLDLKESIRKKIISNITINGASLFPENINIYLTYALIEIKKNKQDFINKTLKKSIQMFSIKKEIWLKIFIYFGTLLLVIGLIILANNIVKHTNKIKDGTVYDIPL